MINKEISLTEGCCLLISKSSFSGVDTKISILSQVRNSFSVGSISMAEDVFSTQIPNLINLILNHNRLD